MTFEQLPAMVHVDRDVTASGDPFQCVVNQRSVPHRTQCLGKVVGQGLQPDPDSRGEHETASDDVIDVIALQDETGCTWATGSPGVKG